MNIKKIYICHTYYHVYSTLIKEVQTPNTSDIVICDAIPQFRELISKLVKTDIFNNIFFFSEKNTKSIYPKTIKEYIICHYYIKKAVRISFKVNLNLYESVYIYNDLTVMGKYLQSCKKYYTLIEDALDINKIIFKYKEYMRHMFVLRIKQALTIGFLPFGLSKYVKSIEVNENKDLNIPFVEKVVEVPRKLIIDKLTDTHKKLIFNVFTDKIDEISGEKKIIILTQPLYLERLVDTEEKQIEIYRNMIKKYQDEYSICIKPHPRDLVEYNKIFENVIIIDKNIPIEIINFDKSFYFDIGITVTSTSINTIENIEQRISVGLQNN